MFYQGDGSYMIWETNLILSGSGARLLSYGVGNVRQLIFLDST